MSRPGTVFLVGAGPGAPDLLTVRAARLLERADIVFHDALVHPDTLALATRARKVAVGKRCSRISTDQRFISRSLVEAAARHEVVVRLKGGDPMLFGRAQEEIDALAAAGVAFEVVPGVTAALAASAELGVSLTRRGRSRSVTFVTPRLGEGEPAASSWVRAVLNADTAALYMAAGQGCAVMAELKAAGMAGDTPVVVVESASLPDAGYVATTLDGMSGPDERRSGPALVLIGRVYEALTASEETNGLTAERGLAAAGLR